MQNNTPMVPRCRETLSSKQRPVDNRLGVCFKVYLVGFVGKSWYLETQYIFLSFCSDNVLLNFIHKTIICFIFRLNPLANIPDCELVADCDYLQ